MEEFHNVIKIACSASSAAVAGILLYGPCSDAISSGGKIDTILAILAFITGTVAAGKATYDKFDSLIGTRHDYFQPANQRHNVAPALANNPAHIRGPNNR